MPADALDQVLRARIVPVVRTASTRWGLEVAELLATSGLAVVEVTFTVPDAPAVITALRARFPRVLVSAGTILDAQ